MAEIIDPRIWERAKQIFLSECPPDEAWGTVTPNGRVAYEFQEREGLGSPTVALIGEEKRTRYLKRAQEELEAEGVIDAHQT